MNAPELLRAYLSKIQDPAAVAALFAEDGVLELPQMNVRSQGRAEIEKNIAGLLKTVPDFRFKNIQLLIETPDQAFGEYSVEAVVLTTGSVYKQTYFGRLVAEKGKIKLLRESLDTLARSVRSSRTDYRGPLRVSRRWTKNAGLERSS